MIYRHRQTVRKKRFYPSILLMAILSHAAYYYLVFTGRYGDGLPLVVLSLVCLALGYLFGNFCKLTFGRKPVQDQRQGQYKRIYHYGEIRMAGLCFTIIGIAAHLYYYIRNPITSYGASYTAGRGSGYITVFFNFWLLGMIVLEFLSAEQQNGILLKWSNRASIFVYVLFYIFVLMKRRQVVLLLLSLFAIWGRGFGKVKRLLIYAAGFLLLLLLVVFGKIRGYLDTYGLAAALGYAKENFTADWFSLEYFEGWYISRTLNDVCQYVKRVGHDPSILLGILFCMVPRGLLGGTKPLAFPEWYTKHFHPSDYARGTGYAGSMVGELYLIGGIPLLVVGYFMIGYICIRVQKRGDRAEDFFSVLIYSLFIYTILLLPRYDLASILIDVVFLYMPLVLCCRGHLVQIPEQEELC